MEKGAEVLSDAELLAVIIRTGSREDTSLELAQKLLKSGGEEGLLGLAHHSFEEFTKIRGIGKVKAAQLLCIFEAVQRGFGETQERSRTAATTSRPRLQITICSLSAIWIRSIFTPCFLIPNSILSETCFYPRARSIPLVISPRELFIEALRARAVRFALVHNHPSGDPTPSREDQLLTMRMKEAGDVLGIVLVDHVIIGDTAYMSFKERGML